MKNLKRAELAHVDRARLVLVELGEDRAQRVDALGERVRVPPAQRASTLAIIASVLTDSLTFRPVGERDRHDPDEHGLREEPAVDDDEHEVDRRPPAAGAG